MAGEAGRRVDILVGGAMRKFTDTELELAPRVAEVMGEVGANRSTKKPLEHDCLEWLRGRLPKHDIYIESDPAAPRMWWVLVATDESFPTSEPQSCDTLLESLYRVILEVKDD